MISQPLFTAAFLAAATLSAEAVDLNFDFANPTLPAGLIVKEIAPGFTASLETGSLHFDKATGRGPGSDRIEVSSTFTVVGDFTITVKAIRGVGAASAGLNVNSASGAQSMYFGAFNQLHWSGWAGSTSTASSGGAGASSPVTYLRLKRSGNTLSSQFSTGANFTTAHAKTSVSLAAPMRLMVFILQEQNQTVQATVDYDDLTISADSIVEAPGPVTPLTSSIENAVRIAWPTQVLKGYQVQWSGQLENPAWSNLGGLVVGTGAEMSLFDPVGQHSKRFYRIQTVE